MRAIHLSLTPFAFAYLAKLLDADRKQTVEIGFASKDRNLLLRANELQNFKIDLIKVAESQGFDLVREAQKMGLSG